MKKLINILIALFIVISPAYLYAKTTREQIQKRNQEIKDAITTKREEFKANVAEIKDTRKQAIVEKIDKQISTLNKKHTQRFSKLLDKLSAMLNRIESRANKLGEDGTDITTVKVAIQNSRDVIVATMLKVDEQANKEYIIEIGSEDNLGKVVSATFKEFKDDLSTLRESIKDARDSVHSSLLALQSVIKSSNSKNGETE